MSEFVQVLRDYGSAPEEILRNDELLDLLMPMTRADFAMIEGYRNVPGPPLACPISAWCGTDDPEVTPTSMCDWASETTEGLELFVRRGGHFFVTDVSQEIAKAVHDAAARLDGRFEDIAPPSHRHPELRPVCTHEGSDVHG
jgi:azi33